MQTQLNCSSCLQPFLRPKAYHQRSASCPQYLWCFYRAIIRFRDARMTRNHRLCRHSPLKHAQSCESGLAGPTPRKRGLGCATAQPGMELITHMVHIYLIPNPHNEGK